MELFDCPTCAEETVFEQPPCQDGHTADGAECPEWVCTACGTALVGWSRFGIHPAPRAAEPRVA